MSLSPENRIVLMLASGLLIIISGSFMGWFGVPSILNSKIAMFKKLDNHASLKMFLTIPRMEFKVYFFNVSNPEEVTRGALPVFNELGPYVYDEYITKQEMDSNNSNTIKYMITTRFQFNQTRSGELRQTDVVTLINLPLLGLALFVEKKIPFAIDLLEEAIPHLIPWKNKLFVTDTVDNLLFHGSSLRCEGPAEQMCAALKVKPVESIVYDESKNSLSFAFFRHKNGSRGPFEADRGVTDVADVGKIIKYKENPVLDTWVANSTCDEIRGTDSTVFPPFIPSHQSIYIFEPDICLSGKAEYEKETDYMGIPASRYVGSRLNFAEEGTDCRCPREDFSDPTSPPECLSQGLVELTPCQGAPVLISQPHFYQGDDHLRFSEEMYPVSKKHQTFTVLDRLTGIPLEGHKRVQINIQLKPIEDISILDNVTTIVFPALWVEEGIQLGADILSELISLHRQLNILYIARWVLLGIGLALILAAVCYHLYRRKDIDMTKIANLQDGVLFNKVARRDENTYSQDRSSGQGTQRSSNDLINTAYNNNSFPSDNYVMTLSNKLYPPVTNGNHAQTSDYNYPS